MTIEAYLHSGCATVIRIVFARADFIMFIVKDIRADKEKGVAKLQNYRDFTRYEEAAFPCSSSHCKGDFGL